MVSTCKIPLGLNKGIGLHLEECCRETPLLRCNSNPSSGREVEIFKVNVFSLEQTRDALLKILQDLRPEDHFSFITFNSKVAEWKSSLLQATADNVASAAGFVQTLSASGGTRHHPDACNHKHAPNIIYCLERNEYFY